ncbi:hypothetical protein MKK88_11575 [Methylobacterium sp. E-005]|uniref:hypothetical protein n=1 Tax=Methylobacterium sp. E-005 TaxID=2836549 RepID=UPI001FBB921F|nr:hypothetical protein [Methylobacterium sp. E-005]MCJ2086626.1 hypothetical protein [Methylobacterium sp. E-005]
MTDLLDRAIARVGASPAAQPDDAARMRLPFAGAADDPVYQLTPEATDLTASNTEVPRGEFVTDDQIRAIWMKHGL